MFHTETEFVRWLRGRGAARGRGLKLGIGDDAALVEMSRGRELILTTDLSIEGVHFSRPLHPPRSVGHRALARSLSDIAAMGGTPRFALVSLAVSRNASRRWIEELFAGMFALATRFGVAVVGGDTAVVAGKTALDVVIAGEVLNRKALRRSGARPEDLLFVSGRLGLSALGLRLLKSRPGPWHGIAAQAVRAHLYPQPQCALGRFLADRRLASALIDVSDGLSTDLGHLCDASGVGARVWADCIRGPKVPELGEFSAARLLDFALHAGEDYQLLFTVPPRKAGQIPPHFRSVPLHRIGEVVRSKEVTLIQLDGKQTPLAPAGYDHFRKT